MTVAKSGAETIAEALARFVIATRFEDLPELKTCPSRPSTTPP